jgi:hypothetical protein
MTRITLAEMEVADAAHYMGYELMRGSDGYVLMRKFGVQSEIIRAETLAEITRHLKH